MITEAKKYESAEQEWHLSCGEGCRWSGKPSLRK